MRLRARSLVALTAGALGCSWLACSSFSANDQPMTSDAGDQESGVPAEAAAEAAADAGTDAPADAPLVIDVPAPKALALDGMRLFIATDGPSVYEWKPSAKTASIFARNAPAVADLRLGFGNMYFLSAGALQATPLTGGDAGAPESCRSPVTAFALAGASVVFGNDTGTGSTGPGCMSDLALSSAKVSLLASDGALMYRFEPDFSRIQQCTPNGSCGANSTVFAAAISGLIAMIADADRVYWATSSAVFSKLKSGGPTVTLADEQALPKTLVALAGTLFWTNFDGDKVMSAPTSGGAPAVAIASGLKNPSGLVVTPTEMFVSESGANRVLRYARP